MILKVLGAKTNWLAVNRQSQSNSDSWLWALRTKVRLPVGRAIAQADSRCLPTTAARIRARIWSCGICGRQSGAGAGFLRVLRFPLPIFILQIAPQSSSSIILGLYNRPEVAAVPSGLSPTPLRKKKGCLCSEKTGYKYSQKIPITFVRRSSERPEKIIVYSWFI
jgi:hypothetical protein